MERATILVPLDGSAAGETALPYAERIAAATGAALLLISVTEEKPARMPVVDGRPEQRARLTALTVEAPDAPARYLEGIAAALRERTLHAATATVTGEPAAAILAAAEEHDATMIVMATHGRGGVQRWLIGSVADTVMRLGTRPALLVRAPAEGDGSKAVALRRLMVPLDGSEPAETALTPAVELATALEATLTLVRAVPFLAAEWSPSLPSLDYGRLDAEMTEAAERYLEQLRAHLGNRVRTEAVVLRGSPKAALAEYAAHDGVDLVVMSTHGYSGLRRMVLGGTADRLVRAGVPVLLRRPPAVADAPQEIARHA